MTLPGLRLPSLRYYAAFNDEKNRLQQLLLGEVLLLPQQLSQAEREELLDALVVLLELPLKVLPEGGVTEGNWILIAPQPGPVAPAPIAGCVVVALRPAEPGDRRMQAPQALWTLRRTVIECLGREHSGTRLQRVATWMEEFTDSPSTALRFADGALQQARRAPDSSDGALFLAGLAAAIGWLLRDVPSAAAEWALAMALQAQDPARLLSPAAALLGCEQSLRLAFEGGLVHCLADEDGGPLDLRWPLRALGDLAKAPDAPDLWDIARALRPVLAPAARAVLDRLLQPARRGLGLSELSPDVPLVGREELTQRLLVLTEPADQVRTLVLCGLGGSGKTTMARALARLLEQRLETIWVHLTDGPEAGWMPVARALDIDPRQVRGRNEIGIPRWVIRTHERLREGDYLVVVDDVDGCRGDELPAWLPSGPGRCVVLVLSRKAQRPLQEQNAALLVPLPSLTLEEGRRLLAQKLPALRDEMLRGGADELLHALGGHPGALSQTAALIERDGLDAAIRLTSLGDADPSPAVLQKILDEVPSADLRLLEALLVCAPEGSPPELPTAIASSIKGEEAVARAAEVDHLVDRFLIERRGRTLRLPELVRLPLRRRLAARPEERERLERRHAEMTSYMADVWAESPPTQAALYRDLQLAVGRMTIRVAAAGAAAGEFVPLLRSLTIDLRAARSQDLSVETLSCVRAACDALLHAYPRASEGWRLALELRSDVLTVYPVGDRRANLRDAISGYEELLTALRSGGASWVRVQRKLGQTLAGRDPEDLPDAIAAFEAALQATAAGHPSGGLLQLDLGDALAHAGDGPRARASYEMALAVLSEEIYPAERARARAALQALAGVR